LVTIIVINWHNKRPGGNCRETAHQNMFVTNEDGERRTTVGAVSYNVTLLDVPRDRHFVQASLAVDKQMRVRQRRDEREWCVRESTNVCACV